MLVDNRLFGREVDKGVARWMVQVIKGYNILGPSAELREHAGHTEIENAISNCLHMLVHVTVEYTTQPIPRGQQCPV